MVYGLLPYIFCGVTPICHISHPSTWFFGLSGSITCCPRLRAASEALTCNQRPACLCQGSTAHSQLKKDWTVYVLGLVCGGFSQQESSGVFLSMGHNGFSSPMKHYSESLSHNTPPSPVKAKPGHHWRYGTDGGLKRGGKEHWVRADGKKKGGTAGNWHPTFSKMTT